MPHRSARPSRAAAVVGAAVLALPLVAAVPATAGGHADQHPDQHGHQQGHSRWVAAWQGSPTASDPATDSPTCPAGAGLRDQTVRDVVPVSTRGGEVRVRVSNAFGAAPLRVGAASVAVSTSGGGTASPAVVPGTVRALSFDGHASVEVPAGGDVLSDPAELDVDALDRLALGVHLPGPTGPATQHQGSEETSYLAPGDATGSDADGYATPISCWLFATGVDVRAGHGGHRGDHGPGDQHARPASGSVVVLGDSITDGFQSTVDADRRFPDQLARRFAERAEAGERSLAVANAGISGNELLTDREPVLFGPAALSRLDRDVLQQSGVRTVVVLLGTNDLGASSATADQLVAGHREVVERSRAAGLRVVGATLLPFGGAQAVVGGEYGSPSAERQRQLLNDWIRTSGEYDAVVDLDAALRDPADPTRLLPAYDSGDHLHPNDAGYAAMADAVDLDALLRR